MGASWVLSFWQITEIIWCSANGYKTYFWSIKSQHPVNSETNWFGDHHWWVQGSYGCTAGSNFNLGAGKISASIFQGLHVHISWLYLSHHFSWKCVASVVYSLIPFLLGRKQESLSLRILQLRYEWQPRKATCGHRHAQIYTFPNVSLARNRRKLYNRYTWTVIKGLNDSIVRFLHFWSTCKQMWCNDL